MLTPSFLVRLAGSTPGALLLFAFYAALAVGWVQGRVPLLLALVALLAAARTFAAWVQVRRYKVWRSQWRSLAEENENRPAAKTPALPHKKRRWLRVSFALAVLVVVPFVIPTAHNGPYPDALPGPPMDAGLLLALKTLWSCAVLYLAFALVRGVFTRRKVKTPAALAPEKNAFPATVSLLVARPSSSPSRDDAARMLPDYAARLMSPRNAAPGMARDANPLKAGAGKV